MGYFGPTGIGAVFYVEHTRHLFPHPGEAETDEENNLAAAMIPVVYFLVLFSIIVHGLSIPALDMYYQWQKVPPVSDSEPTEIHVRSENEPLPNNAYKSSKRQSVIVNNRFSRPMDHSELARWRDGAANASMNSFGDKKDADGSHGDPVYPVHVLQPNRFEYGGRV
jgi:hypothetical protein